MATTPGPSIPAGAEETLRSALAAADLDLLVLFGSRATGRVTTRSDVDLAIQCREPADLEQWHVILAPLVGSDRLDLVDLRRAGPLLAFEVARTGRPLFERQPGTFRAFQALAARRYADTRKLRDAQRRAIQVFLAQHGLA
jgi:predicted nucleotidyltransferase